MERTEGPVSLRAFARLVATNVNFRRLWLAQLVSEIGDWLASIVVYSLLIELTGKAESVGFALVVQVLPQFFVSPMAGAINDRVSRRRVMIFADLMRAAIMTSLILVQSADRLWMLYVLLGLETVMWGFFEPARTAIIPNITRSEEEKVTANTLSSITWSMNFFLGAALGGALAAEYGRNFVFMLDGASFLASAWFVWRMKFAEPHTENHPPLRFADLFDFKPVLEGIRYIRADQKRRSTLMVKAGVGWIGTNYVILSWMGEHDFPIYLRGYSAREAGMLGISVLMAARGVGAVIGPFVMGRWAGASEAKMRWGIAIGFLAALAGYTMLAWSPTLGPALLGIVLAHGGSSTAWVFSTTLLQRFSEDKFRGRILSADFGGMVISLSIASALAGWAVDSGVSVRIAALATALTMIVPGVLWIYLTRGWSGREESPRPLTEA